MIEYTESHGSVTFTVRVVPRASRTEVAGEHGGALKIRIAAPPVEGAANAELVRFLARALRVQQQDVEVVRGLASRTKRVRVSGTTGDQILQLGQNPAR